MVYAALIRRVSRARLAGETPTLVTSPILTPASLTSVPGVTPCALSKSTIRAYVFPTTPALASSTYEATRMAAAITTATPTPAAVLQRISIASLQVLDVQGWVIGFRTDRTDPTDPNTEDRTPSTEHRTLNPLPGSVRPLVPR